MEEKINKRLQELSLELEKLIAEREDAINKLKNLDVRIKAISATLIELKGLLD